MRKFYKVVAEAIHAWNRKRRHIRRIAHICEAGNEVVMAPKDICRVKLNIVGKGNRVKIGELRSGSGLISISIYGDNCRLEIEEGCAVNQRLSILMGQCHPNFGKVRNCAIHIGKGTSIESASVILFSSHTAVSVGANCMLSFDITLYQTDAHPIYEFGTDKIVNIPRTMTIGDHVWIGKGVSIMKNSIIPDGCIVGWGSVVTGRFTEPNSILCGNPARQIKGRKVDWKPGDPRYIANESARIENA